MIAYAIISLDRTVTNMSMPKLLMRDNVPTDGSLALLNSDALYNKFDTFLTSDNLSIKGGGSEALLSNVVDITNNYINNIYPVGSIYKSINSTNPGNTIGGTWQLIKSDYDRACIGSALLWTGASGTSLVSKTPVLGAYGYSLINGLFANISASSNYHREYRMIFQGSTGNDTNITMYLNNIATSSVLTWSGDTFRLLGATNYFKESDITEATTYNYNSPGINLYYSVTGTSSRWAITGVILSGFLTSNEIYYIWKRTS